MPPSISMQNKLTATFWISIGIICLCIPLYIVTLDYPGMSGVFPRLVLVMIGIVTILDLLFFLSKKDPQSSVTEPTDKTDVAIHLKNKGKVLYLAISMIAFFGLLKLLGVIVGTFTFVFISGWCLGHKKIVSLFIASVIIAASVYLIFVVIMETFLPHGYLFELLRG